LFWTISILFLFLAALFVLVPLWRHYRPDADTERLRTRTNLTIFEERQRELQIELDNGIIDPAQYEELLLELQKSLLNDTIQATSDEASGVAGNSRQGQPLNSSNKTRKSASSDRLSRAVPLVMVLLIPVAAYLMYDRWGYLGDVQLMDLYEQSIASDNDEEQLRDLVIALGRVVQEDETNEWAWYFLGRNFSNLGMFGEAEIAFQRASDLMPEGPDKAATLGLLAQIKYLMAEGAMTDEVLATVEQARSINPSENASLQLLAVDAEMQGDLSAAIGYWRLMIQSNPNSTQAQQLRQRIAVAQQQLAGQEGDGELAGPRIEVSLSLTEGLLLPSGMRVFIAVRSAEQDGMPPLAATDLVVDDLPVTVTLDNNMALTPAFNISSAETVYVSATVSRSGSANVQSGDYRVQSEPFTHDGELNTIELVIGVGDVVP